jgi:aldehyde dehydrogenase (NAD+)
VTREELLIGGAWRAPAGSARIEVVDPSTEELLGTVPDAAPEDVAAAVQAARAALPGWAATPLEERCALLELLADLIEAAADDLGEIIAREVGMPLAQATAVQAALPVAVLRTTAADARAFAWEDEAEGARIWHEPVGVVAAITPWNFPLHQIAAKLAPALAAGCPVVLKPSEVAPFNAFRLADFALEAGLPPGVLGLITGSGPGAGEGLVTHPGVDLVSLTGSVRAGRRVGALAGERLRRATLELGGKSPCVILDDADLETAVGHAIGRGYLNSGQACNASTRILVPRERLADAEAIATDAAGRIVVGPALADGVTMGPLVSAAQRDRVRDHVHDAIADGARVVFGGPDAPEGLDRGWFLAPTLFSDVDPEARVAREEIFGPVLCLFGYDDEEHAIALANDTDYGLAAEVFTTEPERATRLARRLRAGQVKLNGVRTRDTLGAPFGGVGDSGLGREFGRWGLQEYVEVKAVLGA